MSIHAEKARAGLYRLRQDEMTVLQYAHVFESYLAQLGDYDESYYLAHFIFGLCPEIMRGVYIQQPESLPAAKNMAGKLELTHLATSDRREHTNRKKTSKAQRKGTQEWWSGKRNQQKTCKISTQRQKKKTVHSHIAGCKSAQSGAREASCLDGHGPAAMWRSILKDLPLGDRAGRLRRQGSVVMVSLEALTRGCRNTVPAGTTEVGMSMHPPSGRAKAPRVYLHNRLL